MVMRKDFAEANPILAQAGAIDWCELTGSGTPGTP
jgi:hypothetical protein